MANKQIPFCSDEELLEELKNLGYDEVPSDVFQLMKQDLANMVSNGNLDNIKSSKLVKTLKSEQSSQLLHLKRKEMNSYEDSSFNNLYSQDNGLSKNKQKLVSIQAYNESSEKIPSSSHVFDKKNYDEVVSYTNPSLLSTKRRADNIFPGVSKCTSIKLSDTAESLENIIDSDNSSKEVPSINISLSKYRNSLKNYQLYSMAKRERNSKNTDNSNNEICDIESSLSSLAIKGKLKRKVLQHKEGKPVIKEKIVDIPSIFNSSYPETISTQNNSKLSSSFDLSFKSNSSTGSLVALSPESLASPRSTVTVSTISRPKITPRRKKHDPVAMYNYYKKFWDNFQPPGEKNHDKLRWAVRDRMLDYSL